MSVFQFNRAVDIARGAKGLPILLRKRLISKRITSKRQELRQIKNELRTAEKQKAIEHKKRKKRIQQELFELNNALRAAEEQAKGAPNRRQAPQIASESETGALPDFVLVGARKCGTTFLYHLLAQHPYVEPAAKKELHYFDILVEEESIEWYRRCFPQPSWKDGRRTITGEATPYLDDFSVPKKMVKVLPQARLIALLRNPVDRAYSDYHQGVRKGRESRTFEEAIEQVLEAVKTRPLDKEDEPSEHEYHAGPDGMRRGYLSRGVYVNHLLRWSEYFGKEQMLVLKSEDFFERPSETLKPVLDFLDLPDWEPGASEIRNKGKYEQAMDPSVRRRLEEFFEPHNRRLYEYLGLNFGW